MSVSPYSVKLERVESELTTYEQFLKSIQNIRMSFIKVLEKYLAEPYSSLASGVALGATSSLTSSTKNIFKDSGLIHLMVLSGTNVSFVITWIWLASRRFGSRSRVVSVLSLAWIFILMTGLTAPAVRAGIMTTLAILAEASGRAKNGLRGLVLALGIQTFLHPMALINSASLHLSFLVCFGLFIVAPTLEKNFWENPDPNIFQKTATLTLSVSISTAFYILGLSGQVNLFGGLLTILAEPLVTASTIVTFLTILFHYIFSFMAVMLSYVNTILLNLFLQLAEFGSSSLPLLHFSLPKSSIFIFYFFFITFFSYLYFRPSGEERGGRLFL